MLCGLSIRLINILIQIDNSHLLGKQILSKNSSKTNFLSLIVCKLLVCIADDR